MNKPFPKQVDMGLAAEHTITAGTEALQKVRGATIGSLPEPLPKQNNPRLL